MAMDEKMEALFGANNMSALLAATMLEKMTEDERKALLAGALAYLMTPQKDPNNYSSGPGKTAVQSAFNQAASMVINKVARDVLEADADFRAACEAMVTDAVKAALAEDSSFASDVGTAVAKAMINRGSGGRW